MDLFRVFSWDGNSLDDRPGGPLHIPRSRQGSGRHDNPGIYGAIYASTDPVSAIAEAIQTFRSQTLVEEDLQRVPNRSLALVTLDVSKGALLMDLDDPRELVARNFRPSQVASSNRKLTRAQSLQIFQEGLGGFLWWSTLEASWINCTLFAERAEPFLSLKGELQ